jgi:transposase
MNRVYALSDEEMEALEQLHRDTDKADIHRRCDMILWSSEGLSPPEMAKRVRFSCGTVTNYIQRYEAEGLPRPDIKPRPGRAARDDRI